MSLGKAGNLKQDAVMVHLRFQPCPQEAARAPRGTPWRLMQRFLLGEWARPPPSVGQFIRPTPTPRHGPGGSEPTRSSKVFIDMTRREHSAPHSTVRCVPEHFRCLNPRRSSTFMETRCPGRPEASWFQT